jgi:hypothetical protein
VAGDGVTRVMTGSWLIVKWAGIGILSLYVVLIGFAIVRFRDRLSRMRSGLFVPIALGNFVSLTLPWLFMNARATRVCFVAAQAIFVYGMAVLVRNLARRDREGLLKADS